MIRDVPLMGLGFRGVPGIFLPGSGVSGFKGVGVRGVHGCIGVFSIRRIV